MKKISAQKGIIHLPILLVILAVVGLAIWFFLNKDSIGPSGVKVQIPSSQMMPSVSAAEARTTVCNLKKEGLFAQVCEKKFDTVGQEDIEKIAELFSFLDTIKNDKNLSDYDRTLLAQAVFAALPAQDTPTTQIQSSVSLDWIKNLIKSGNTVYAQGQIMSEEEFKELMKKDLQRMSDSVPKGDNAWVINVMVSRYEWVNGKSRPYYSTQYMQSSDPFPSNPNLNPQDITYHVQSVVGSQMSGQTVITNPSTGTSEMIAYSFTIMSWQSPKYETPDGRPVEEEFNKKIRERSHPSYYGLGHGVDYIDELLASVRLPSTNRPVESPNADGSRDINSKESPSPKPSAPTTSGSSNSSSEDACRDSASFCKAIKDCANQATEEDGKSLSYEERYQRCSKSYQEGWYEAAGWLSCPWWKEQELKGVCYESKCNPLSKEIEARRGDDAYREWDKVTACMEECDEQAKQAAASLKLPKCDPASR